MKLVSLFRKLQTGAVLFGVSALSFAQGSGGSIDTSTLTTAITAAATAVGVIGAAVVAGPVIVKATYRWIRGAV
jgi:hypothetical protein